MSVGGLSTILFTDVVGSTDLHARLGDKAADSLIAAHIDRVSGCVAANGGELVKTLGDGVLARFRSARRALVCAAALQAGEAASTRPLPLRVGLAAGEVIDRDDDVHGLAVAIAARIAASALGGQILAADLVRRLAGADPTLRFVDRGPMALRGVREPTQIVELDWSGDAVRGPVAGDPSASSVEPPAGDPFVGRVTELAALHELYAAAEAGRGAVVLLMGEAGIGKTRLAESIVDHARSRGAVVLWGECWEGDGAPAFWPWSRALGDYVDDAPDELRRLLSSDPAAAPTTDELRFLAFNQVASMFETLGRDAPVVLVLDDVQWADRSSVELLRVVAHRARSTRCLVVGTCRADEVDAEHPISELGRDVQRIDIGGLTVDEVSLLVGARADAATVTQRTGGNPFFVREVMRGLASGDALPSGVRDVLTKRVGRLPEPTRGVLAVASVLGRVDAQVLAPVAQIDVLDALDALDGARRNGLLAGGAFAHALVRETIYGSLASREKIRLHLAVARTLAAEGRAPASEVAHHYVLGGPAGDPADIVRWATAAGADARERFAYWEAVTWFEAALAALAPDAARDRAELLLRAADARSRAGGDKDDARAECQEAATLARSLGDTELLARTALAYADIGSWLLEQDFGHDATLALVEDGLAALPQDDSALRAKLLVRAARTIVHSPDHERGVSFGHEALAMARRLDDEALIVETMTAVAHGAVMWEDSTPAVLRELVDLTAVHGAREATVTAHVLHAMYSMSTWDRDAAELHFRTTARLLEELHIPRLLAFTDLHRSVLARYDGRIAEAEAATMAALHRPGGSSASIFTLVMGQLMLVRYEQDRISELGGVAGTMPEATSLQVASAQAGIAWLEAAAGNHDLARMLLAPFVGGAYAAVQRGWTWLWGWAALGRAAIAVDDRAFSAELYELGRPYDAYGVETGYGSLAAGSVAMYLAELALHLGRPEDADGHLDLAEEQYTRFRARGYLVESTYLRAATCRALGDDEAARDLAGAAARDAEQLGMARVARLSRELLAEDA